MRTIVFLVLWAAVTALVIVALLHDIATHEWIKEIVPKFSFDADPFPVRFVPAILFRNYPSLCTAVVPGVTLAPTLLLFRAGQAIAARLRRALGERKEMRIAHEEPPDHPPVVRTVRTSSPPAA